MTPEKWKKSFPTQPGGRRSSHSDLRQARLLIPHFPTTKKCRLQVRTALRVLEHRAFNALSGEEEKNLNSFKMVRVLQHRLQCTILHGHFPLIVTRTSNELFVEQRSVCGLIVRCKQLRSTMQNSGILPLGRVARVNTPAIRHDVTTKYMRAQEVSLNETYAVVDRRYDSRRNERCEQIGGYFSPVRNSKIGFINYNHTSGNVR